MTAVYSGENSAIIASGIQDNISKNDELGNFIALTSQKED
jgi:hypothetical protein